MFEPASSAADLAYCRDALPKVSRTFAINIRLLSGSFRDVVRLAYLMCRTSDALEDSWEGAPDEVRARFDHLIASIGGDEAAMRALVDGARALPARGEDLELVRNYDRVWRVYRALEPGDRAIVGECVTTMARGMSRYSARAAERGPAVAYLDDEGELRDYCWIVAGCVGVMLTKLFTARAGARTLREEVRRIELAPVVGEALQLTNILLDWPLDVRRGRCYVPGDWLAAASLTPADLVGRERPEIRPIESRLESLARRALARVPEYLELVPRRAPRYRLFVLLPALWALRSVEKAARDPEFPWGARRPKLTRGALLVAGLSALVSRAPVDDLRTCEAAEARA